MINADDLHEAEQQALGQLAQMDLALAARLHQLAMNADDPKEIADHVRSYQRASRSVRQTIMLRARLRRDHERPPRAAPPPRRDADSEPQVDFLQGEIDRRVMHLQEASSRIVAQALPSDATPAERAEALDRIDAWIDLETEVIEDFVLGSLDEQVLALCRACGLPEELGRRFRDLPRAPRDDESSGPYNFEPRRDTG